MQNSPPNKWAIPSDMPTNSTMEHWFPFHTPLPPEILSTQSYQCSWYWLIWYNFIFHCLNLPLRKVKHLYRYFIFFSFSLNFAPLSLSRLFGLWFMGILNSLSKLAFCCYTYASPHLLGSKSPSIPAYFFLSFLTLFVVYFDL